MLFCNLFFSQIVPFFQKLTILIGFSDPKSTDAVTDTEGRLVYQSFGGYGAPVQRTCHHYKRAVPAFCGAVTEIFIKIKQFRKIAAAHHLHDTFVVLRTFRGKSVRTILSHLV